MTDTSTKPGKSTISVVEGVVTALMFILIIGGAVVLGLRFGFGLGA